MLDERKTNRGRSQSLPHLLSVEAQNSSQFDTSLSTIMTSRALSLSDIFFFRVLFHSLGRKALTLGSGSFDIRHMVSLFSSTASHLRFLDWGGRCCHSFHLALLKLPTRHPRYQPGRHHPRSDMEARMQAMVFPPQPGAQKTNSAGFIARPSQLPRWTE